MPSAKTLLLKPVLWLRRGYVLCLTVAVLWALAPGAGAGSEPEDIAIIRCNPAPASQLNTTTISVDLYVENVVDMYGADAKLLFDSTALQVVDASVGQTGVQIQPLAGFLAPDFVIRNTADNRAGSAWYAVTQNGQIHPNPVSGSGAIARLTFQALKAGAYVLPFDSVYKLAKKLGDVIPAITQACSISFWGPINLVISRTGSAANTLSWSYLGSDVHHAEVWRSATMPYLTPSGPFASRIVPGPAAGDMNFADTDAGAGQNQFYVLRAVKADNITQSAASNQVGAFHFALIPGSPQE